MTTLDMTPGAQIPRLDVGPQTAVSQALASAAYRDSDLEDFFKIQPDVGQKEPRFKLFRASLGEAFTEAVIARTLGTGRKPVVPSFGTDPRLVVEHCLEAQEMRNNRDRRLTAITVLTGVLFLPGALLWLAAFQLRAVLRRGSAARENLYSGVAFLVIAVFAALFLLRPPAGGLVGLYLRVMTLVPVAGWFLAKRICRRSTEEMRGRWSALVGGTALGPMLPKVVPRDDQDAQAVELRTQLDRLAAEQETNIMHYAGTKGVLGLGRRWGSWHITGPLLPKEGSADIRAFHPWDVIRRITDRLGGLKQSEISGGGMPNAQVRQWVMMAIGEGAGAISRPTGADTMDGERMRDFAVQNICNGQKFGAQPRHYLSTQFVLWEGQLVVTLLTTATVLQNYLRIEVTGYVLGPVVGLFTSGPSPKEISFTRPGRPWKTETRKLPVVDSDEVVRLAVRAPLMWSPVIRDWFGGKLALPEPFGLRSAWTDRMWTHRFMADDTIRAATPVIRLVRAAVDDFLADHDVDVARFGDGRSLSPGAGAEGVNPGKPDVYDAN
jgi:hypothetical protein